MKFSSNTTNIQIENTIYINCPSLFSLGLVIAGLIILWEQSTGVFFSLGGVDFRALLSFFVGIVITEYGLCYDWEKPSK